MPAQSQQQIPNNLRELVQSINIQISGSSQYRRFQRMYYNDRIAFVYDCIPDLAETFAFYQTEILGYYDEGNTRVAVRGPHGLGKTTLAAILTHHSVLTAEEDCKVPTTASAWRQLEKYLWPEIKKIAKMLNWTKIGRPPYDPIKELLTLSIRLNQGTVEAFALASDDHTSLEGAHGTRLVYIFDEAKTIPRPTWDAAEGAFANAPISSVKVSSPLEEIIGEDYVEELPGEESNVIEVVPPVRDKVYKRRVYGGTLGSIMSGYEDAGVEYVDSAFVEDNVENVLDASGGSAGNRNNVSNQSVREYAAAPTPPPAPNRPTTQSLNRNDFNLPYGGSISEPNPPEFSTVRIPHKHSHNRNTHHSPSILTPDSVDIETFQALAFAISTPGDPSGQFYDIHMHKPGYDHWKTRHVTVDEAIRAKRISPTWVVQMQKQWGEDSSIYQNRVLGEFADMSDEGVIPLSWVRLAVQRWMNWDSHGRLDPGEPRVAGVDVARAGDDTTVVSLRNLLVLTNLYSFSKLSTTSTAGHVKRLASGRVVNIEMDGGLGAAVYDILKDDGFRGNLRPVTVSANTTWRDRSKELQFLNVRAAMWWNMRELLDPDFGAEVCLPPVEQLILDLSTPLWEMKRGAVVQIESKTSIKSRLGRSTDYGDSCCLAFWKSSSGGGVVF